MIKHVSIPTGWWCQLCKNIQLNCGSSIIISNMLGKYVSNPLPTSVLPFCRTCAEALHNLAGRFHRVQGQRCAAVAPDSSMGWREDLSETMIFYSFYMFLPWNLVFSCRFSLKPIQWINGSRSLECLVRWIGKINKDLNYVIYKYHSLTSPIQSETLVFYKDWRTALIHWDTDSTWFLMYDWSDACPTEPCISSSEEIVRLQQPNAMEKKTWKIMNNIMKETCLQTMMIEIYWNNHGNFIGFNILFWKPIYLVHPVNK